MALRTVAMLRDRALASPALLPWLTLIAVTLFDLIMAWQLGWQVTNWSAPAIPCAVLAAVAFGYGLTGRSAGLASTANWLLLWTLFSLSGTVLSYVGATRGLPILDDAYMRWDRALGVDWASWSDFVHANPVVQIVLSVGYGSMMPQVVFCVLYFCWRGQEEKNAELMLNGLFSLLITVAAFSAFPALGPAFVVPGLQHAYDSYLTELIALRDGSFATLDLSHMKGIIVFPSFHTVMALLLTYVHRGSRLFIPALLLNCVMLLAIPIIGGHYVVDMLAGAAVTGVAILLIWIVRQRFHLVPAAAT